MIFFYCPISFSDMHSLILRSHSSAVAEATEAMAQVQQLKLELQETKHDAKENSNSNANAEKESKIKQRIADAVAAAVATAHTDFECSNEKHKVAMASLVSKLESVESESSMHDKISKKCREIFNLSHDSLPPNLFR